MAQSLSRTATLSQRIAAYVHELSFDDLPAEVIEKAKNVIAYDSGQGLQGFYTEDGRQAVGLAERLSGGVGTASVIGVRPKAQPLDAAFANCSMMRAPGMDDVLEPVGIHAGLVTLPAGLALAEDRARSGKDLLVALVAGYEVMGKLGKGIWAWDAQAPRRPTIPFGPFGTVVVAGKLLRLDPDQLTRAIGYAAHSAMGLAEAPWTHYYSLVTRNGMMGAFLAEAGGETPATILEAEYGFFRTFFGSVPAEIHETLDGLGTDFEMLRTQTKRYPGTGRNIVPLELVREIVQTHGLHAGNTARVEFFLPVQRKNFAASVAKGPFASAVNAASSLPFQTAMILLDGETDHARYAEFASPEMARLIDRIDVTFETGHASSRYARVRISGADGESHVRESDHIAFPAANWLADVPSPGNQLLPPAQVERAAQLIAGLDSVADVSELMACLRPHS